MSEVKEMKDNGSDDESQALKKYSLEEIKKMDIEKVYEHIQNLYKNLKSKTKKYKNYKSKFKDLEKKFNNLEQKQKEEQKCQAKDKCGENGDSLKPEDETEVGDDGEADKESPTSKGNEMTESTAFDFVNEMRQVAEHAQNMNDFVYEPTSGLYYDQKSGYYYNAEYGLYYDGNTGCYYSYNAKNNSYEFHSQVQVQPTNSEGKANDDNDEANDVEFDEFGGVITDPEKLKRIREEKEVKKSKEKEKYKKSKKHDGDKDERRAKRKREKKKAKEERGRSPLCSGSEDEKRKKLCSGDVEEGELSESSSSDGSTDASSDKDRIVEFKRGSRFQDIARHYPPSLRIIIQETNLEELKVGSLNLITYKGGTLGREATNDVVIPDVNVSKCHLKFLYDHKKSLYKCLDLGSRNGTILNGSPMSNVHMDVVHGSIIQIGYTKILCHIHEGNRTCGLCEPGLLMEQDKSLKPNKANEPIALSHKEQLKQLQKKYGLENEKFVDGPKGTNGSNAAYNDRAATRRQVVGSSSDKEKTQTASVDTAISSENKGFKMLSKLGWNKGEALGKTSGALLEPINVASNEGTKGLGCDEPSVNISFTMTDKRKLESLKKTQERYQKASDMFLEDSD